MSLSTTEQKKIMRLILENLLELYGDDPEVQRLLLSDYTPWWICVEDQTVVFITDSLSKWDKNTSYHEKGVEVILYRTGVEVNWNHQFNDPLNCTAAHARGPLDRSGHSDSFCIERIEKMFENLKCAHIQQSHD